MFEVNYVFDDIHCIVEVKLGEELSYDELANIREEVRLKCADCSEFIAIYNYALRPSFTNFSLTAYRKMSATQLDILINVGVNVVQRSFMKLVHRIKPSSKSVYFADTIEEAIELAKDLLPNLFSDTAPPSTT